MTEEQLARYIDNALIQAAVTEEQIKQFYRQAKTYGFFSVCVNPRWVPLESKQLADSKVKVDSTIAYKIGADSTKIKVYAVEDAIHAGADEIDMVADLTAIVQLDSQYFLNELQEILQIYRSVKPKVVLKVIIETVALTNEQKIFACQIAQQAGVDFIKTSTGREPYIPSAREMLEDIKLIRRAAPNCKAKASGKIRTAEEALELLNAGAEKLGTSTGAQIINQFRKGEI